MIHRTIQFLVGFCLISGKVFCADSDYIKCPLVWVAGTKGEGQVSSEMVSSTIHGEIHYLIRAVLPNGQYVGGRLQDSTAFIPNQGVEEEPNFFEVLTNPHKCILNWYTGMNLGIHAVSVGSSGNFVGRSIINNTVLGGNINAGQIAVAVGGSVVTSRTFDTLQSYSKGMDLEVTDFTFPNGDPSGASKEFLGIDEIHNRGDTDVLQVVTHKKRTFESVRTTSSSTWSHTFKASLTIQPELTLDPGSGGPKLSASFYSMKFGYEFNKATERNSDIYYEKETDISVTREVIVPPHTSVQICSVIDSKDNFILAYEAKGRYTAPGLTAAEIQQILSRDGITGIPDGDFAVDVAISGTLSGSIAMATKFIIIPYDSIENCSQLQSKIVNLKKAKRFSNLNATQIEKRNDEIEHTIRQMTTFTKK